MCDALPICSGSLLEPFLKIVHLMRSLEFEAADDFPLVRFKRDLQDFIGQEPYQLPSVFSFFKPKFRPAGKFALIPLNASRFFVIIFLTFLSSTIRESCLCRSRFARSTSVDRSIECQYDEHDVELSKVWNERML
jgi:hypothetical protein